MSQHRPRTHRIVAATAAVLLAGLAGTASGLTPPAAAASSAKQPSANSVTVTVLQVEPTTPAVTATPRVIKIRLQLTNTTDESLGQISVDGARGNPISNQDALDAAITKPTAPDPTLVGNFKASTPVVTTLGPNEVKQVTYASTTSTTSASQLCLCQNRIYPLYFAVHQHTTDGSSVVVGSTQTFIPSFGKSTPVPVKVSWVWPILEPPHRTVRDDVFTDDDLTASITNGRLDRLLQVVEDAGPSVAMTVLIDPDLLDELAVMASGKYQVQTSATRTTPGTGASAAQQWLLRLRSALDADPKVQLAFTPFADPDVDSLTRNALPWTDSLSSAAQSRVSSAVGGRSIPTDIAWPVGGALTSATLNTLVHQGMRTVILSDTSVPGGIKLSPRPDALAPIKTPSGTADVAVTSSAIEQFVTPVVSSGGTGSASLPQLVSEVAIRAEEDGTRSHFVVITAPRDVDPDPAASVAAMLATAGGTAGTAPWARSIGLRDAIQTIAPVPQGALAKPRGDSGLPSQTIDAARFVATSLPALSGPKGMIQDQQQAAALLGSLADGVQRSESSEWRANPTRGIERAQALRDQVDKVTAAVQLVHPTRGTYTLGSADSPLPITIDNTLDASISVRVRVSAVGGLPGFSAHDLGVQSIDPLSKKPLHIPVHVDRAGRIKVQVELTTPDGEPLGAPLELSVRSTALGTIGKIITFAAGFVLAAALLLRVWRRWRKRGDGAAGGMA